MPHVVESELAYKCEACPWDYKASPLTLFIVGKLNLKDAGAPLERYELTNAEWLLLGRFENRRFELIKGDVNKNGGQNN